MHLDCDVAVVGAGPAGSRTARDLARDGLRVLLLEEHRRIGVPSHCSGMISPRTLGLPRPAEYAYNLGIEGRLSPGASAQWRDDYVHVFVGHELAPGWFGWIIPTGETSGGATHARLAGRQVRVGIGTTGAVKPVVAYRRLAAAFPELFSRLEVSRMYGGTIPLTFAPRSFDDHALLVGDAAGQVKPFSGGGIYTSLVAARHAAGTVRQAFERDAFGAKSLASYERGWKREIGRELRRSWHLRHFGLAMSGAQIERVVRALQSPGLRSLADSHADIDYPSRVLLRLARSLPALANLGAVTVRRPGAALNLVRAHLPV